MRSFVACVVVAIYFQSLLAIKPKESREMLQLWESVLTAKGGRARLYELTDFLWTNPRVNEPRRPVSVQLIVFPDKVWTWFDQTDSVLGGDITVSDGVDTWMVTAARKGRPSGFYKRPNTDAEVLAIENVHAKYLLETKWLQPRLIKLETARIGREDFDVITAKLGGGRMAENEVKYFINPVSHLVRRVIFDETWEFEDYQPIDGIMMPTKEVNVDRKSRINYTPQFGFNVEFEPSLFKRRPAIENGPDAWKPSR